LTIFDGIMGCRRNGLSEQWAMGIMGRLSNRLSEEWLSEKWAVGIMGCRNYDLTPNNHLTKWPKMPMYNPNLYILLYIYLVILYIRIWVISCHECYWPLSFVVRMSINVRVSYTHIILPRARINYILVHPEI